MVVTGHALEAFALDDQVDALRRPAAPPEGPSFLPMEDNYLTFHGGPGVVTDPLHHDVELPQWGGTSPARIGDARHLGQRVVVMGGLITALWELEPKSGEVVWAPLGKLARAQKDQVEEGAQALAGFIRDELGHARSFSLDTDAAVAERAEIIRRRAGARRG